MNIRSGLQDLPKPRAGSVRALLLCTVLLSAQAGPVLAHENTLPSNAHSLVSLRGPVSEESAIGPCCRLTVKLVDADTQQTLPGLVRITDAQGQVLSLAGLVSRGAGLRQSHPTRDWSVLLKSATLSVPQGRLTIEAFSGLETELTRTTIDVEGKSSAEITIPLVRFYDAATSGWRNGNTHLHLRSLTREQADEYLKSISQADGLELVFVSYLRRARAERDYISNTYTEQQLQRLSGEGVTFSFGEEHRHNFGPGGEGYGHVMFLNIKELIRPVSIGPGIMGQGHDWPSLRRGIDQARQDGATTIWCHNAFGFEEVPDWIAGVLDAHNIFDGGSRGSYEDTFYRFMDIGLRVPFSTGTDWFIYDFSRVYVRFDKALTIERWLDGLEKGRTFITNGLFLDFSLGAYGPGDLVRLAQPKTLNIRAQVLGRCDFQKVEVIYSGRVAATARSRPVGGHFEARINRPLLLNEPGWLALRIVSDQQNELGAQLFGHTSAVYVEIGGSTIFKPKAARELIADMNKAMGAIREKASFAKDEQVDEILSVYRKACTDLRKRLERQ